MAGGLQQLNVRQIEDGLSRLRDVYTAKVILNEAGDDIDKVHVLASLSRNPKQIVRDIESLLFVKFHVHIDYRRVSLVQMRPQDLLSYFRRPKLVSVKQDADGELSVEVCLAHADDVRVVGKAQTQADAPDMCHVAALATIRAVSNLLSSVDELALKKVEVVACASRPVALVYLSRQTTEGEEHLLGASLAIPDLVHGVVHATLDALNRRCF